MGTFTTTTAFSDIFIGTTMDTTTTNALDHNIDWAESEVLKWLSKRYDLTAAPFTQAAFTPPMIKTMTEWLAESYFHETNSRGSKDAFKRADRLEKRALMNLKLIADYEADLLDSTGSVIPDFSNTAYSVLSNSDEYATTFNEDDPLNWKIDPDKLTDIANERSE